MCLYWDRADDFAGLDATIVGISAQDSDSHQGFIEKNNLTVPLLAGVEKHVAKAYSASSRFGMKRAVILIDEDGIVRHRHDHLLGLDYQSVDDLKAALATPNCYLGLLISSRLTFTSPTMTAPRSVKSLGPGEWL
jgi:peroxiredoxin Q/BCP